MNPAALRTMVSRFLTDTCTIRQSGTVAFDADAGEDTETTGATVYTGCCRVRPTGGDRLAVIGDAPRYLRLFDVTIPWDTVGVTVDDVVTITASNDPHMVDRVLRVTDVLGGSDTAHRRLICQDTLTDDEGAAA